MSKQNRIALDTIVIVNDERYKNLRGVLITDDGSDLPYEVRIDGKGDHWFAEDEVKPAVVFKVGDTGKTKRGFGYEVIAIRENATQPLVVEFTGEGNVFVETCSQFGSYYDGNDKSDYDLLPPAKTKTVYINVYDEGTHWGYDTEEFAKQAASPDALAVAHKVVIDLPA